MRASLENKIAGILKIAMVAAVILLQLLMLVLLIINLKTYAIYVYVFIQIFATIEMFLIAGRGDRNAYTIAWLLLINILPVFGQILYILWGNPSKGKYRYRMSKESSRAAEYLKKDPKVYSKLGETYPYRKRLVGFLGRKGFPIYENTSCHYYPLGELQFKAMIEDMKKAKRFIFIETFILTEGQIWDEVSAVLTERAAAGVEVRVMFDDLGSITTAPGNLVQELGRKGIKATRFNPIYRYISRLYINYRNHQKITVIDGNIGYTGGTNYADEYANLYEKHGHWKDTAIRLTGDAVWSLTVNFLQFWDGNTGERSEYENYKGTVSCPDEKGFYQPFSDGPINTDNIAEAAYLSMIATAKNYVYIATPYLVIDSHMIRNLITAAQGGVDVRIITPKVWDKWYVHTVTRSNYGRLLKAGVKIYEYTPGYIHAKTIISDDVWGITGSINMDYRSFNLHFENGVLICGAKVLGDIKDDLCNTFEISEEVLIEEWMKRPFYIKALEVVLRIFEVLL